MTLLRTCVRTPWRPFHVVAEPAESGAVVVAAWFGEEATSGIGPRGSMAIAGVSDAVEAWIDGELSSLDAVPVRTVGSDFAVAVWSAMRSIRVGSVETYGMLAARAGHPGAARAAGTACARNAIGLFIPCHRVVASTGLGGYGWDPLLKARLLEHEGVDVVRPARP